ncbi:MAG: trypsin-like peptidase domain-containing protein [Pseudomonadota bacterium]
MRLKALIGIASLIAAIVSAKPSEALPPETLQSVVSVLPVWPGHAVREGELPNRAAPEGSGIAIDAAGLIATAWHVVKPAERIDVRLADGRVLPATLVGQDEASDVALLRVAADLPLLAAAPRPDLADPVCLIGNAYGLGLSVSCGVVSALDVSNAGFNPVEDFVQTDAAANPGSSGGALVDSEGRLVGMMSAIFASESDANIGVNFAVSSLLLERITKDLADDGKVDYVKPDWRLEPLASSERAKAVGARVEDLDEAGVAARAGIAVGDLIKTIGDRRIHGPRDAIGALALVERGQSVSVTFVREGQERQAILSFVEQQEDAAEGEVAVASDDPDCPHPEPVCAVRQAVFPIASFDPIASAVRIDHDLLVTNRHVIGDRDDATVHTPAGPRPAKVVPSAYRGDLTLLQVEGLPDDGLILTPKTPAADGVEAERYFAVGADIARQEVRVFAPGELILEPSAQGLRSRLHVTAVMQPGVSGGALVDQTGSLAGIAVGGGEGRYEALPMAAVSELLAERNSADADAVQQRLGDSLVRCASAIETAGGTPRGQVLDESLTETLMKNCRASENAGQYLEAGRVLALAGRFDEAVDLHSAAVAEVPHSINARLSLLVSLQLGGRFQDMLPHARWLSALLPDDPQAQRFAIQSGVWGDDPELADLAYSRLLEADPRQAQAAKRFIDQPPPAPQPR